MDVLVRIRRFQIQQLSHYQIANQVFNRSNQEDHAFLEQPGVDVVGVLTSCRLLKDRRHQGLPSDVAGVRRTRDITHHSINPVSASRAPQRIVESSS